MSESDYNLIVEDEESDECFICAYKLILDDIWECPECHQKLHEFCYNKHKETNGNNCPFCRLELGSIQQELPENELLEISDQSYRITIFQKIKIVLVTASLTTAIILFISDTNFLKC